MAGWDTLLSPVIYHEPVAPVVPKPDNTAAELISHGTDTAVGAFLRAAQMRQQAEIDQKRMVQDAALTMRGQDITAHDADLRYLVGMANADRIRSYQGQELGFREEDERRRQEAFEATQRAKRAQQDAETTWFTGLNDLNGKAYNDAKPLLDPNMAVDNPGALVVGSQDWNARYGAAREGAVPALKNQLQQKVDSLTAPFVPGAEYVTPTGSNTTDKPDDPKKQLAWRTIDPKKPDELVLAAPKLTKLVDLYNQYQTDPRGVEKGLIAAGHGSIVMEPDPNNKNGKIATPKLDKWATNLLKSFGTKRENPVGQVPADYMSTHKDWQVKQGIFPGSGSEPPEGDLPEQGGPGAGDPGTGGSVGGYIPGRSYSGRTYTGGDPHDPANWQ